MVGASKILTVSYGTFSCTLEGFDDPFSAMKSIAEYFRDLAADDRYFGAEPPTPDAEMLHRIAEREARQRVETRVRDSGNGIVLRQVESDAPAYDEPPAYEDVKEPAAAAPFEPAQGADEDSVAAKLSRIRAVVERARSTAPAAALAASDYEDLIEDAPEGDATAFMPPYEAPDAVVAEADAPQAGAIDLSDDEPEEDTSSVEHMISGLKAAERAEAEEAQVEEIEEEIEAEFEAEAEDDVHAEAADEVQDDAGAEPEESVAEDEIEVADEDTSEELVAEADDDTDDFAPETVEPQAAFDRDAPVIARAGTAGEAVAADETDAFDIDEGDAAADEDVAEHEEVVAEAEEDDAQDDILAETYETIDEAEDMAPEQDDVLAEAETDEVEEEDDILAEADEDEITAEVDEDDEADEDDDDVVAEAEEDLAEAEEDEVTAEADEDDDEGETETLADRIVRLKQAEVEHGYLSDDDEDNAPVEAPVADIAPEKQERRRVLIGGDPATQPSFDRILEETNSKMAESEGTRRRSAIAHLKAAVAATKADRLLKRDRSPEGSEREQSQYREDLAKVVRPRPSEPRENAAEREAEKAAAVEAREQGGAPLMLVSSQRVDGGAAGPADADEPAVRPRRIGAGMLALDQSDRIDDEDDDDDFVEFATSMGARDLPDLLEAAAAYIAFVEGQPHFSRPQIMRRAAVIETEEEFTREAGLRSFGQLLRQGRIRKLQRGQFTIAETTRFNPGRRIAGE